MRALKIIGIILLVLLGLLLIIPAFLPSKVNLESSTLIKAPAELVFEQVNTLENWDYWTPFKDSNMVISLEGNPSGVGAIMKWSGTSREQGVMEIVKSEPNSFISTMLRFEQQGSSTSDWKFEETAEGVKVSWSLHVENLKYPIGRFMGLAFPMLMNPMFTKGLDSLRAHCERLEAAPKYSMGEIRVVDVPAQSVLMISDSVMFEDLEQFFSSSYGAIMQAIAQASITAAGAPMAIYHSWVEGQRNLVSACIPVSAPVLMSDNVKYSTIPATKAVMVSHFGPYNTVGVSWNAIEAYIKSNGLQYNGAPWEVYMNDPKAVKPIEIQTDIYYPVK